MSSKGRGLMRTPGRVAACVLAIGVLGGCQTTGGLASVGWDERPEAGPPAHAPAHGARAKHQYHYYPAAEVYFDVDRRVYFYVSDGKWVMSAALPMALDAELGARVALELETARPYDRHAEHRERFPAHRAEGRGKGRGKGKGRDKGRRQGQAPLG